MSERIGKNADLNAKNAYFLNNLYYIYDISIYLYRKGNVFKLMKTRIFRFNHETKFESHGNI